ncbi:sensor histidine kinase [Paenibacillus macerans]|uniref:sensor histidine kinase n=1 Tax=Paenibacillus macerans TaxID=44252 RepID=UPI003D31552A
MFNSTRNRLTVLNASVFFIILTVIGLIVYIQLRHHLFAKVDESLVLKISQNNQVFYSMSETKKEMPLDENYKKGNKMLIQVQGIDPRVFLVLWDEQGNALPILASTEKQKAVDAFKAYRDMPTPSTVKVDGHYYRIYSIDYERPVSLNMKIQEKQANGGLIDIPNLLEGTPSRFVSVQAISIVDSEQNMLRQLLILIVFGIFTGGALTVLAGLYLANKALEPIRKSWDKQQRFVADASHELRMPLSIIRANAEFVFRHPDRSILQMSEPLSMVLAESKRMGKLTDQLLTLARADSNQEELLVKPLPLADVIIEALRKFATLAELKQISLHADLEERIGVLADRERLQQLLVILLDNSIKFTAEKGTIRVTSQRKGHRAELTVADTGAGIPAADLPHIFDRFYRGDKARDRSQGGTGLGLAIAKWIVDKHGGTIAAASKPGSGTTITISLPLSEKQ